MSPTPREVFLKLVHGVCEERWEEVVELYAEKTHVEHPLHPPALRSREEVRAHFGIGAPPGVHGGHTLRRQPTDIAVHETADPEVIVAEFRYEGTVVETREPFSYPAIFVMRVLTGGGQGSPTLSRARSCWCQSERSQGGGSSTPASPAGAEN
ncbi:nuclear transport factor 2 family protein [Spirillospora sp. NPDC047279]|uniref:nuclear transport factor 2 family protein n=1 Tax=Spirillospora sp. NPDC047279 TaxID=3155478 RepID=UPI0033D1DE70